MWNAVDNLMLHFQEEINSVSESSVRARLKNRGCSQGCQMIYLHTKNANLGTFSGDLDLKLLAYFMFLLNVYGHLVYFMAIWYTLRSFGTFIPFW
jgi:hypothetical protein